MKICAAQTRPLKGDIAKNIDAHNKLIKLAVDSGASLICFPELSLTGYEPTLAKELAIRSEDPRLDEFQILSDLNNLSIALGAPVETRRGIALGMIIFVPGQKRQVYSKQYLHEDEYPFFVNGLHPLVLTLGSKKIAPAICFEISVPQHATYAHEAGADFYMASVAKSATGVEKALDQLSCIARDYSMQVLIANSTGPADDMICGGRTSAFRRDGSIAGQLDDQDEGILVMDTGTEEAFFKMVQAIWLKPI